MPTKDEIIGIFYEVIQTCVDSISLPSGKTLFPVFLFSAIIFAISLGCYLLELPCLIKWEGALIATGLQGGLCALEWYCSKRYHKQPDKENGSEPAKQ